MATTPTWYGPSTASPGSAARAVLTVLGCIAAVLVADWLLRRLGLSGTAANVVVLVLALGALAVKTVRQRRVRRD